jgi:hypothetical protein
MEKNTPSRERKKRYEMIKEKIPLIKPLQYLITNYYDKKVTNEEIKFHDRVLKVLREQRYKPEMNMILKYWMQIETRNLNHNWDIGMYTNSDIYIFCKSCDGLIFQHSECCCICLDCLKKICILFSEK